MTETIDRNYTAVIACPHCAHDKTLLFPKIGDRNDYRCPDCGVFSVDGTTERLFELGTAKATACRFVIDGKRRWLRP